MGGWVVSGGWVGGGGCVVGGLGTGTATVRSATGFIT